MLVLVASFMHVYCAVKYEVDINTLGMSAEGSQGVIREILVNFAVSKVSKVT